MIWFKEFTPAMLNDRPKNHIGAVLGIEFTEVGDDFITATMPVDERTHQPAGILHGGASVV
jgi:1,4-dihydroxy-2-naphthoyl-CoA hydrolase